MKMNVRGLIIKVNNVRDYDRFVLILTKEHGILPAYANGARRIKSKKMASTGLLSYADFTLASNNAGYHIEECSPISIFYKLREDFEALTLAQYFCELCQNFIEQEHTDKDYLPLILNSLSFLESKKRPLRLIKAITELRLLTMVGYMPDLSGCECADNTPARFDAIDGVLGCKNCLNDSNVGYITLNQTVVTAMRYICTAPDDKLYNFTIPNEDIELLCNACERYVLMRAERNMNTLKFYNSIRLSENK